MITASPVDDEQMHDEPGDGDIPGVPPAARRFLDRHRPIGISSEDRGAEREMGRTMMTTMAIGSESSSGPHASERQ